MKRRTLSCADMSVLQLTPSSRIGDVVKSVIGVFIYFGSGEFDVHEAAHILAGPGVGPKRVLRRLYLVTQILDAVNVFKHKLQKGMYVLTYGVDQIIQKAFKRLRQNLPPDSIMAKVSRLDWQYLERIHAERRRAAHLTIRALKEKSESPSPENSPQSSPPDERIPERCLPNPITGPRRRVIYCPVLVQNC